MKFRIDQLSIGAKLTTLSCVLVAISFSVFALVAISSTARSADETSLAALSTQTEQVVEMMAIYDTALRKSAELAANVLASRFPGGFSLDPGSVIDVGGMPSAALRSGGKVINNEFGIVDGFTADTGAIATVFARNGDDFVRVSTSLKKQDGARAVGTALDRDHPAYQKLIAGEAYAGKVTLFGRDYMTRYLPVRDADHKVVGSLFIGLDFTEGLKALSGAIRAHKIGETGYFYALDAAPGKSLARS